MKTITGKCILIKDKNGQNYLGADIEKIEYLPYENFMLSQNFVEEVNLKLLRDKGNYHITIINTAQWGALGKKNLQAEILSEVENKEFSFIIHGIGKAEKENNVAYFVIVENEEFYQLREKYSLGHHDFHMTLGFKDKDVFGVSKNKDTCLYSNSIIDDFLEKQNMQNMKLKLKA